jgi:hypothetical protein
LALVETEAAFDKNPRLETVVGFFSPTPAGKEAYEQDN